MVLRSLGGGFEHGRDGVAGQGCGLAAVQAVEHRPGRGQLDVVGVELGEVDLQVREGLVGERHGPGLVPLAGQDDMAGRGQDQVVQGQVGEFADAGGGVVEQDEQHPVPA